MKPARNIHLRKILKIKSIKRRYIFILKNIFKQNDKEFKKNYSKIFIETKK